MIAMICTRIQVHLPCSVLNKCGRWGNCLLNCSAGGTKSHLWQMSSFLHPCGIAKRNKPKSSTDTGHVTQCKMKDCFSPCSFYPHHQPHHHSRTEFWEISVSFSVALWQGSGVGYQRAWEPESVCGWEMLLLWRPKRFWCVDLYIECCVVLLLCCVRI